MLACACVASWIYLVYFIADVEDERNLVVVTRVDVCLSVCRTLHLRGSFTENINNNEGSARRASTGSGLAAAEPVNHVS
jgi:hypothetical protein